MNAEKVKLTGNKREQKIYYRHTGWTGPREVDHGRQGARRARTPSACSRGAVRGMLPKNSLGRQMFRKLKVYAGPEHPHAAQKPEVAPTLPEAATAFVATGKRKTAVARVRLQLGTGQILVNGRTLEEYFPREASRMIIHQPLETVNGVGRYDIAATLHGGGISGQADALRHGITRALEKLDPGEPRPRSRSAAS